MSPFPCCRLAGILALLLLSACSTPPRSPSEQQLRDINTVEVLVTVPPSAFSFVNSHQPIYVQPSAGVSVGAGVGINVVANLLFAGIDHAVTATAREAQVPVGKSVEDIDLPQTALAQLQALRGAAAAGPVLMPGRGEFPKTIAGNDPLPALVAHAKATGTDATAAGADATLFIRLTPSFRDAYGLVSVLGEAWLINRSGDLLLLANTRLIGADHPQGTRSDVVNWWADGRYRRLLRHGTRAVLMPVAQALWEPPLNDVQRAQLEAQVGRLPVLSPKGAQLRSSACALDSDDASVVYRFERQSRHVRAAALCQAEAEADSWPAEENLPGISWFSSTQPSLPAVSTRTLP